MEFMIINDPLPKIEFMFRTSCTVDCAGLCEGRGAGRHIGHKLRVGGDVGRYTRYSKVLTPYTEVNTRFSLVETIEY